MINAIAPTPPHRLIIAFACDLSGLGVTSGIKATAGDPNVAIAISTREVLSCTQLVSPCCFSDFSKTCVQA